MGNGKVLKTKSQMIMRIAELSEANKTLENIVKIYESTIDDTDKLIEECERLKKEVLDLNFYIASNRQVCELGKYRQVLQDIRDIVKTEIYQTDDEDELQEIYRKIEDKISEAIGNMYETPDRLQIENGELE